MHRAPAPHMRVTPTIDFRHIPAASGSSYAATVLNESVVAVYSATSGSEIRLHIQIELALDFFRIRRLALPGIRAGCGRRDARGCAGTKYAAGDQYIDVALSKHRTGRFDSAELVECFAGLSRVV
jgi:hypothetical protein